MQLKCNYSIGDFMRIVTVKKTITRDVLKCEDSIAHTSYANLYNPSDNNTSEFLKPMSDYIAQLMIEQLKLQ